MRSKDPAGNGHQESRGPSAHLRRHQEAPYQDRSDLPGKEHGEIYFPSYNEAGADIGGQQTLAALEKAALATKLPPRRSSQLDDGYSPLGGGRYNSGRNLSTGDAKHPRNPSLDGITMGALPQTPR